MNNENHNNGRGIFYGVIGVATLVVAIIGATFAYFTASQSSNAGDITGNAASVSFGLRVVRAETTDQTNGGLIPMSNSMVQSAVYGGGKPSVGAGANNVACVDDNGNSVCQIYKVTVTNTSSAALFLDGYITLTGGLANATASTDVTNNPTVMRWAQVFKASSAESGHLLYSTGTTDFTDLGASNSVAVTAVTEGGTDGLNKANICNSAQGATGYKDCSSVVSTGGATINGNSLDYIAQNYIRISSKGQVSGDTAHAYTRSELEDALVFNLLVPVSQSKTLYFVVWLHENGLSQNPTGQTNDPAENNFFGGIVTFMSGQGGEVSATFSSVAKVSSHG